MKIHFRLAIFWLLILSACASPAVNVESPTQTSIQSTLSVTPTTFLTKQVQPSRTLRPPNTPQPSRTPRPTSSPKPSPSPTPTFDVASVAIYTPSAPEKCPAQANIPLPKFSAEENIFVDYFSPTNEEILNYLNAGGDPNKLIISLRQNWRREEVYMANEIIKDVTEDGVPEILIAPSNFHILGCQNGEYKLMLTEINDASTMNFTLFQLVAIQDLNLNGMPEVILALFGCGGMKAGQCLDIYIYEWNGRQFISLNPERTIVDEEGLSIYGGYEGSWLPNVDIKDIDNNGTKELILKGGNFSSWYFEYFQHYPWRDRSKTYIWNGQRFVFLKEEFSKPEYRYQAVQDGDRAMLYGDYDKALVFYQDAIFSDKLWGWSTIHKEYYISLHQYTWDPAYDGIPTPNIPPDDPEEFPNLAAYARYRIMMLHVFQGNMTEAKIVYDTLQEKFPEGNIGHEFALMAQAFWDEYAINPNLELACRKAIEIAKKHPSLLNYLGNKHHNIEQDIMYSPEDVCPFK